MRPGDSVETRWQPPEASDRIERALDQVRDEPGEVDPEHRIPTRPAVPTPHPTNEKASASLS
jgi:hypothetical protein